MHHLKQWTARRPRYTVSLCAVVALILTLPIAGGTATAKQSAQATVPMGDATYFGALSAAAMTNNGLDTVVNGDIGSSTSIDVGVRHPGGTAYGAGTSQLANAQAALLTAYGNAEAQTPTRDITGLNLAGQHFGPGVYNSSGSILISGPTPLVLDGGGNADAVFIFQAASSGDLTVDPTSSVSYINGAQPCNIFWKVQSAFLKNTGFTFVGTILALTQITLTDSVTVHGRVLARNADVTFIHDTIVTASSCQTQASVDAATTAANTAAAAAAKAAADAAKAAADAKAVTDATAAKAAADAKTAADAAAAAATKAAAAAKAADVKAAKAAAARAVAAAKVAKTKAAIAKAARVKAAKKVAGATSTNRGLARPPIRPFGFTG